MNHYNIEIGESGGIEIKEFYEYPTDTDIMLSITRSKLKEGETGRIRITKNHYKKEDDNG
jgi:hypothetical protein